MNRRVASWPTMTRRGLVVLLLLLAAASPRPAYAQEAERLEPVVVTATRAEQPIGEAPASVTVLSREDIRQGAGQSLDDLLRQGPRLSLFPPPPDHPGGFAAGRRAGRGGSGAGPARGGAGHRPVRRWGVVGPYPARGRGAGGGRAGGGRESRGHPRARRGDHHRPPPAHRARRLF